MGDDGSGYGEGPGLGGGNGNENGNGNEHEGSQHTNETDFSGGNLPGTGSDFGGTDTSTPDMSGLPGYDPNSGSYTGEDFEESSGNIASDADVDPGQWAGNDSIGGAAKGFLAGLLDAFFSGDITAPFTGAYKGYKEGLSKGVAHGVSDTSTASDKDFNGSESSYFNHNRLAAFQSSYNNSIANTLNSNNDQKLLSPNPFTQQFLDRENLLSPISDGSMLAENKKSFNAIPLIIFVLIIFILKKGVK